MPLYSYLCAECGPFQELRAMSAYEAPAPCPECHEPAPRQLEAPMLRGETSSPSPARPLRHAAGCGCCSSSASRPSTAEAVAAAAPRRGPSVPAGSFLTRA